MQLLQGLFNILVSGINYFIVTDNNGVPGSSPPVGGCREDLSPLKVKGYIMMYVDCNIILLF